MNNFTSRQPDRCLSVGSSTMRLDSANVDPVNGMVIKHVGCSSIHMNLADGVGTFCMIIQGIGLEC